MAFVPIACPGGGGGGDSADVELTILCDVDAAGVRVGTVIMVQEYDADGVAVGPPVPTDPATGLPYVVVGTLLPCEEAGADVELEVLCDLQADGSSVTFLRHYVHNTATGALIPAETFDTGTDGTPYAPTGTVGTCEPYRQCIPASEQDLAGDCGPGEPASSTVILADGQAPNSVITDDPTADALCGGTWGPGPDPQSPPFPVDESFRNATFDQPGPVTQGTAPYAGLTASPGFTGSNVDPAGDGWLQTSDINSGTNGIWQVPAPFPTTAGATASITFASHDGTAQGGDGMAFVFTDGAVAAQAAPIGGFGNLGLQNWQGGYVAVVLDEYGQTCTCDHTAPPGGPFAGPCGFCTNTISIQLAGTARQAATCACCTIATASVAPHQINGTTRSTPGRLIVSIIEEAGQTYVSASVIWPGDTEPVQYFNRVNVTACAGTAPASLRMAVYGGSGGSFRSEHEFRDARAIAAGIQDWRSFPVITDPIPACVTQVNITAEVDVTFVSDTQSAGNSDNEAWFWLVNTVTNTIVDRAQLTSIPSQVGNVHHLTITSGLIPVADLPNYRIYVGAETRDQSGEYGHLWENLDITVSGSGCPVVPRRTMEISAVCPIPVTIVGGGTGDGEPTPPAVFNAPATFEDAVICATVAGVRQAGFRREVRTPDGNIAFSFLGTDGVPITPDTWTAGSCGSEMTLGPVCWQSLPPGPFSRAGFLTLDDDGTPVLYDESGALVAAGTYVIIICTEEARTAIVLCDQGNGGQPFVRSFTGSPVAGESGVTSAEDVDLDGNVYVPVGPVGVCAATAADREVVCWTTTAGGATVFTGTIRHSDDLPAPGWLLFDQNVTLVLPSEPGLTFVPCEVTRDSESFVLCSSTPAPGTQFIRTRVYNELGVIVTTVDTTLTGAPFAPGVVSVCTQAIQSDTDFVQEILCDANGTAFIRRFTFNSVTGAVLAVTNLTLAGAAFAPVGAVGLCSDCCPQVIGTGCVSTGSGFYTAIRATNGTISLIDSVTGAAVLAANIIPCPTTATGDTELVELCDDNGPFERRFTFDAAGTITSTSDFDLDGAPYATVGLVFACNRSETFDSETQILCDDNGPFFQHFLWGAGGQLTFGNAFTLTGAPYVTVGTIRSCSDSPITLQTRIFNVTAVGTPWTPAMATGVITSVTATGITGTWQVDPPEGATVTGLPAGYTATWSAADDNILDPPAQIIVDAASRVVVVWTER